MMTAPPPKKNRPRTFILLMTLNVETLEIAYWSVNKCLFDITLSFKKKEEKKPESWFMLMSSLIGIGKIALAYRGSSRLARRERTR